MCYSAGFFFFKYKPSKETETGQETDPEMVLF